MDCTREFQELISSDEPDEVIARRIGDLALFGADLDELLNDCGWTPAHILAQKNKPLSLAALAEAGGDIETADIYHWTPLDYALQYGKDYDCATAIFEALTRIEDYREEPEYLYLHLFELLLRQRRDTAQGFVFIKLGRCIEMALAQNQTVEARRMVEGVLESLRGRPAEFSSELMHVWRENAEDETARQFFSSEIRQRFEYEGARFAPDLRLHFEALGEHGKMPASQSRPSITIAPGIIDYPAA